MKKITLIAAVGLMMGLASCDSTTDPKLNPVSQDPAAVSFEINQPAVASQLLELSDADKQTFEIVVREQPDYGFPAAVKYTAQASLTGNWSNPDEVYDISYDVAQMGEAMHTLVMTQKSLADAITYLSGYTKEIDPVTKDQIIKDKDGNIVDQNDPAQMTGKGPVKVLLRAVAKISNLNETVCYSNSVEFKQVEWFIHFREPGYVYLIGAPQGWNIGSPEMTLYEADDQIGTQIYQGDFEVNAGDAMFRFYTVLGDWDNNSFGSQADDNPLQFTQAQAKDGVKVVKGKGSFDFNGWWPGGKMRIVLNLDKLTLTVTPAPAE